MRPKNNIPEKTTHGICCTTPEMVTRWVVWASIGCHMGGGVLINHRHPCPNPRQKKKTWSKLEKILAAIPYDLAKTNH